MNEKIKALWDTCRTTSVHAEFGEYIKYSAETFAELIIKECAKASIGPDPDFMSTSVLEEGAARMFKHFGIKE